MAKADEIREAYDKYVELKKNIRWEIKQEVERLAQERVNDALVRLSASVREAFSEGVSKGELREATRSYTNSKAWNLIWDAAANEVPVDVAPAKKTAKLKTFELVTDDPKDQGAKYIQAGSGATFTVNTGPDGEALSSPVAIRLERHALRGPWRQETGAEWWHADDEEPTVYPEFQSLIDAGWTIEAIEAEYLAKGK